MKFLIALVLVGACLAAEDQQAEESHHVSPLAAHPLGYSALGAYPYSYGYPTYQAAYPSVYSTYAAYPAANRAYTPYIHHLKKRDTAAAEDQQADESHHVVPYAAHPLSYAAVGAYPYSYGSSTYQAAYPSVYSTYTAHPAAYRAYTPYIHHLKKRDTAAAEDQQADDALLYSTYATHPYGYQAYGAYPYSQGAYPYSHGAYYGSYASYPRAHTNYAAQPFGYSSYHY